MTSARSGEVRVHVDASPERVWKVVSDIDRMGEYSPECYRVIRLPGPTGTTVGARFKGSNRSGLLRWSVPCEIKVVEPERELTFATVRKDRELTRWSYRLQPADGGTDLVESFEAVWWPMDVRFFEDFVMRGRNEKREAAMRATLDRMKAAAEQPTTERQTAAARMS